jgi:hypothetical protein
MLVENEELDLKLISQEIKADPCKIDLLKKSIFNLTDSFENLILTIRLTNGKEIKVDFPTYKEHKKRFSVSVTDKDMFYFRYRILNINEDGSHDRGRNARIPYSEIKSYLDDNKLEFQYESNLVAAVLNSVQLRISYLSNGFGSGSYDPYNSEWNYKYIREGK